jgi:hypothetical protein
MRFRDFRPGRVHCARNGLGFSLRIFLVWIAVGGGMALTGCEKPEDIRVYTVPKQPKLPLLGDGAKDEDAVASVERKPTEILGAIIPRGEKTWYFKFMGAPPAVEMVKEDFARFIHSVGIGEKGPEWTLPEGWQASAGNEIRFATIRVSTPQGKLEMTVIPLPTSSSGLESQLLDNINRWRDQLGLSALTESQLSDSKEVVKFELQGEPVWVADLIGSSAGNPMAPGPSALKTPSREPAAPKLEPLPFDCQVPESWQRVAAGRFQLAVFEIRDGNRKGTVSVSMAGGEIAANINRWRDQLGLPAVTDAELASDTQKIQVDGNEGMLVDLVGSVGDRGRQSILGVIVPIQERQWFFKFSGDAELAEQLKPQFEAFVKSVKFR